MSATSHQRAPLVIAVGKSSKQRRAEAAAAKPVVRKTWSGKIASIEFPAKKPEEGVNNRYAKVIVDLDGADKTITYYFWMDKGTMYDLNGMINTAIEVRIQRRKADGTARCHPVDLPGIKQHMLANKIPNSYRDVPADARAVLQRTVTDPGLVRGVRGLSQVLINPFTRQVAQVKEA